MILAAASSSSIHVTLGEVAAALALVAIAAIASRSWHAGLEEDIGIAVVRSFIQLTAIGYVITVIFDEDSAVLVVALIAAMVVFGAFTARAGFFAIQSSCIQNRKNPRSRSRFLVA